jgi:hypothetical protein
LKHVVFVLLRVRCAAPVPSVRVTGMLTMTISTEVTFLSFPRAIARVIQIVRGSCLCYDTIKIQNINSILQWIFWISTVFYLAIPFIAVIRMRLYKPRPRVAVGVAR